MCLLFYFCVFHRSLSKEQKALISAFAETETNVKGTINGVVDTSSGELGLFHHKVQGMVEKGSTVKPVLSGHLWNKKRVVF